MSEFLIYAKEKEFMKKKKSYLRRSYNDIKI